MFITAPTCLPPCLCQVEHHGLDRMLTMPQHELTDHAWAVVSRLMPQGVNDMEVVSVRSVDVQLLKESVR